MQNDCQIFRGVEGKNIFYLHIPKTAGSAINKLFVSGYGDDKALTHIESKDLFGKKESKKEVSGYKYLSGHIPYPRVQLNIDLCRWASICTFRRPEEQLASHFSWVRLLAEPGHEDRLGQHTASIRKIVSYMKDVDLSSPDQIAGLIEWLEGNKFYLFHNAQTRYLCGGNAGRGIEPKLLHMALDNLDAIDFVGIVERMDEFILMLAHVFQLGVDESSLAKENSNSERFGLDLSNKETRKVVEPLIAYDRIICAKAREKFIDQYHSFLAVLEKNKQLSYTTVNINSLKKAIIHT